MTRINLAHDLRSAIVDMSLRYGGSSMRLGCAYGNATLMHDGKPAEHWRRARDRQFRALQRLSRALRELATEAQS